MEALLKREQLLGTLIFPAHIDTANTPSVANCRWYYNQDVQLITFYKPDSFKWRAAIVPVASSLASVSSSGGNKDVLLFTTSVNTFEELYTQMNEKINNLIGEIYREGGLVGVFAVNRSKLPRQETASDTTTTTGLNTVVSALDRRLQNIELRMTELERRSANTASQVICGTEREVPLPVSAQSSSGLAGTVEKMERMLAALEKKSAAEEEERRVAELVSRLSRVSGDAAVGMYV